MANAASLATSRVTYAEMRAALARAWRMRRVSERAYRIALETFGSSWTDMNIVEASEPLVRLAGDLAECHSLRGLDAIHLASALVVQREGGQSISFSAWDDRLIAAAADEGLLTPHTA